MKSGRGYTYFAEGDVLFAKITPCMQNGKHAIARGLINGLGFGTTEFHVLRPTEGVISEWVHNFVLQPWVLRDATAHFTGAVGQQRVPENFLTALYVPLPPLPEQRRIVAILSEQMVAVEKARAATESQLEAAKALPAAYLRAVFNSPEAQKWPRHTIGDVALSIQNGLYKSAEFYGHGHPFLRMYNISSDSWKLDTAVMARVEMDNEEAEKLTVKCGDLLVSRVNSYDLVGKCGIAESHVQGHAFENMLIRVRLRDSVNPLFVAQQMNSKRVRDQVERVAKRAIGQASINSNDVSGILLGVPSLAEQDHIAGKLSQQMAAVEQARHAMEQQLDAINRLPAALLRRAFNGEI